MSKEYKPFDICATCLHEYSLHYYDEEYDFHGCSYDWGCRTCGDDYCDCKQFVLEETGRFFLEYHTYRDGQYVWIKYEDGNRLGIVYDRERLARKAFDEVANMHRNTYNGYGLRLVKEVMVGHVGEVELEVIYQATV